MKFIKSDPARDKKLFKRMGIAIVIIACLLVIKDEILWDIGYYEDEFNLDENTSYYSEDYGNGNENCNVAKIDLKGFIDIEEYEDGDVGSSDIIREIENADNSGNIKAIILDIDSSGGVAVAGEEISNAFSRAEKPTVSVIRTMGLSAAYWSAIGTDMIFASANSDVGSIGVTISYVDNSRKNQIEGLTYNKISSGKFKDTGDSDKILTYEEKLLLQRDVDIVADNFIKAVAEKRNLDISKVRALADGSTMAGQMALDNGLIDKIGDMYSAKEYLSGLLDEEVIICE
ncbi:MAG: signal peptide peptidase SppA [Candidatus Pacebacteria bacterium]|nr:signal peptide peptidase SppA [Candidatus Paceibacterota bacterium]